MIVSAKCIFDFTANLLQTIKDNGATIPDSKIVDAVVATTDIVADAYKRGYADAVDAMKEILTRDGKGKESEVAK